MAAFDHAGLSVGDLDAMAAWYAQALGLRRTNKGGLPAIGLEVEFVVSPEGWAIELLHIDGSGGGLRAPDPNTALKTQGYGHIALRVADVDASFAQLIAAGASERMAPRQSPEPGVRMAFVADPEGNLIELLDRPGPAGYMDEVAA